MRKVKLWDYTFCDNGDILTKGGNIIKPRREILLRWGKEKKPTWFSYKRLIYYVFNQNNFDFYNKNIVITQKNGNKNDYSLKNLTAINKKDYIQGENNPSAKLTDEQVEEIIKIYNGAKNKNRETNSPNVKVSYRKLAEKYGVSHTMIMGIVKGQFRNKKNYIM